MTGIDQFFLSFHPAWDLEIVENMETFRTFSPSHQAIYLHEVSAGFHHYSSSGWRVHTAQLPCPLQFDSPTRAWDWWHYELSEITV